MSIGMLFDICLICILKTLEKSLRLTLTTTTSKSSVDLLLISELLNMPSLQPDYRESRSHEQFITNLNLSAGILKQALANAWQAKEPAVPPTIPATLLQKYNSAEWTKKF